jgi:hypothetical protein
MTLEEILQLEQNNNITPTTDYQSLRRNEYPSIGDQLDALWKGGEALVEMSARIQAVKTKYPKPE